MCHAQVIAHYARNFPNLTIRKNPELPKEGFRIKIGNGIPLVLESSTDAGAFYGLLQLRDWHGKYPEGVFEDSPALAFRGFHFTMAACGGSEVFPNFERMKEIVVRLAEWRYNVLVFEYDDHFPWKKHADIVNPASWTAEELREIIRLAESYFIEVVPLLDSLGHAQPYLKHPEYAHLAETPGANEMCPSNPETLSFMEELWDEVLDFHPNARYAHITGDEVYPWNDSCPRCRTAVEQGRFADLYCDYYTKLSRYILSKGKRPVVWGDMLLKYPQAIDRFPRDIVICDWDYTSCDMPRWDTNTLKYTPEHTTPPEREALFRNALDARPDGTFRAYPTLAFFREQGFEVLGSSSSSIGEYRGFPVPWQNRCVRNQRTMAGAVLENGGLGLLNTCWSQSQEGCFYSVMAGGAYAWNPRGNRDGALLERFNAEVLNLPSGTVSPVPAFDSLQKYLYGESEDFSIAPELLSAEPRNAAHELLLLSVRLGRMDSLKLDLSKRRFTERDYPGFRTLNFPEKWPLLFFEDAVSSFMPVTFPAGVKRFGKLTFELSPEKVLRIAGNSEFELPVGGRASEFEFVVCGCYIRKGFPAAFVEFRYADGSTEKLTLNGGDDVPDWFGRLTSGAHCVSCYSMLLAHDLPIQAALCALRNPHPEKDIAFLRFLGPDAGKTATVLLAAACSDAEALAPERLPERYMEEVRKIYNETFRVLQKTSIGGRLREFAEMRVLKPRLP